LLTVPVSVGTHAQHEVARISAFLTRPLKEPLKTDCLWQIEHLRCKKSSHEDRIREVRLNWWSLFRNQILLNARAASAPCCVPAQLGYEFGMMLNTESFYVLAPKLRKGGQTRACRWVHRKPRERRGRQSETENQHNKDKDHED